MTRDEPVPLGDALEAVGRQLGLPAAGVVDIVVGCWTDVAGADMAGRSRVRSVRDGECVVEVDEPAWATRVRYLAPALEKLANERAGGPLVRSVKVVVAGPRRTV